MCKKSVYLQQQSVVYRRVVQALSKLGSTRLVTSPATPKSKYKSTLSGQVQVRVQVLFQKAKSKSKSSTEKRTRKHFYSIPVFQYPIPELILKYSWQVLI